MEMVNFRSGGRVAFTDGLADVMLYAAECCFCRMDIHVRRMLWEHYRSDGNTLACRVSKTKPEKRW